MQRYKCLNRERKAWWMSELRGPFAVFFSSFLSISSFLPLFSPFHLLYLSLWLLFANYFSPPPCFFILSLPSHFCSLFIYASFFVFVSGFPVVSFPSIPLLNFLSLFFHRFSHIFYPNYSHSVHVFLFFSSSFSSITLGTLAEGSFT